MARVTVEDCLRNVPNMYEVVLVATKRVRQLAKGSDPLVKSKNRLAVTALREIAAGKVASSMGGKGANHSEDDDLLDLPH